MYSVMELPPQAGNKVVLIIDTYAAPLEKSTLGDAHLHCTTPALAGGARERSAVQVSRGTA